MPSDGRVGLLFACCPCRLPLGRPGRCAIPPKRSTNMFAGPDSVVWHPSYVLSTSSHRRVCRRVLTPSRLNVPARAFAAALAIDGRCSRCSLCSTAGWPRPGFGGGLPDSSPSRERVPTCSVERRTLALFWQWRPRVESSGRCRRNGASGRARVVRRRQIAVGVTFLINHFDLFASQVAAFPRSSTPHCGLPHPDRTGWSGFPCCGWLTVFWAAPTTQSSHCCSPP